VGQGGNREKEDGVVSPSDSLEVGTTCLGGNGQSLPSGSFRGSREILNGKRDKNVGGKGKPRLDWEDGVVRSRWFHTNRRHFLANLVNKGNLG